MPEEIESTYTDCPKCGVHHSKLVKHRCFKEDEAPPPPESENGGGDTDDKAEGDRKGGGQGGDGGQGDGGEGQGEGQGEGDGDGEGEGQGDGEGEGPKPQPPEPEAPPVAVVCTVLKFAALTGDCAKNGSIEVSLTEDGIMVYGHNGDLTAMAIIPWGEFEKRSTLDGEFYVKEVIDEVDAQLLPPDEDVEKVRRMLEEAKKPKRRGKAKPEKVDCLGLPLRQGQTCAPPMAASAT